MVTPEMEEMAGDLLHIISRFTAGDHLADTLEGSVSAGELNEYPEIRKLFRKEFAAKIQEMIRLYVKVPDSRLVPPAGSPPVGDVPDDEGPVRR